MDSLRSLHTSALEGMRRPIYLVGISLFAFMLHCEASGDDAKAAIESYFLEPKPVLQRRGHGAEIEICFDTCDLYRASNLGVEGDLWEAVFVHQFYFNAAFAAEAFRSKYSALGKAISQKYSKTCPETTSRNSQPNCIANHLIRKLGLHNSFVRYDEGYRCVVSGSFTKPSDSSGKGKCSRVKKVL